MTEPTDPNPSHQNSSNNLNGFNDCVNRRSVDRVCISCPCIMIPILAEGFPDPTNISVGFAMDISRTGIGFEVAGDNNLNTNHIIFGLEDDTGEMNFVTALVRFSETQTASRRIGAEFASARLQLFSPKNILPFYDSTKLRFETGLSIDALQAWENCGVLVETMHDRILVCPQCQSLPSWRNGCPSCGSAATQPDELIHHYACAYIGLTETFDQSGERMCPKCRVKDLVVGADFEFLNGPHRCNHCGWTDSKLSPIGNCLACGLRFPGHQALEKVVNGYDVNRLDPLVYLS